MILPHASCKNQFIIDNEIIMLYFTGSISFAREVEYDYYEDHSAHNSEGHSAHDYEDHSAHNYEDHSTHDYEDHIARTYDYEYDSLEPTFECQVGKNIFPKIFLSVVPKF